MKFDSIIFDLDGTIWDCAENCTKAWNIVLDSMPETGIHLETEDLRSVMGKTLSEIEDIIFAKYESKQKRHELLKMCTDYQMIYLAENGGVLYPEVENTLKALKEKYRLAIVSNCEDGYIDAFFKAHGLEKYFEDYEYWERTGLEKAENISLVINRRGFKNSLYVGDTQGDCNSAKGASVPFIYAAYGFGKVEGDIYKEITAFSDLNKIL